jgi:hypothetical protein
MVRGSNPGVGEILHTCLYRPWGPPSLLYDGYRVCYLGVKRPGRDVNRAAVKERVELHDYSACGSSCLVTTSAKFAWPERNCGVSLGVSVIDRVTVSISIKCGLSFKKIVPCWNIEFALFWCVWCNHLCINVFYWEWLRNVFSLYSLLYDLMYILLKNETTCSSTFLLWNFACFIWVWNLVTHIEGGMLAEDFLEQGAEEDIWA